ncbi:uncharacterized protein LOC111196652 [Astyanax mexicanus]|uniref:DUF7869 domain-containing protein n=1 Tax=Astyanax mexicanus TaxID=7994 RepID=A0A8T2L4F2_ASTMX|nr:uncharacterized protein LOC111196652 [Astyanax mexicanus]KAG9264186.1 hypothetical protein AMEX_G22440 [Astyanax mexicanus]KAG9268457.1 hypothetical protein AMEX_G17437 [Astyanax mexicanus]KAG9277249.1 hypothetical protein AMEX_G7244 [Astyanax mexicanus]
MAQSRGKKMVELALKRKYPEYAAQGIPPKRRRDCMEEKWVIPDTLLDTSLLDTSLESFDLSDDDIDSYYVPTPSSFWTQTEVEPIQTELEPAPNHSLTELEPTLSHSPTKVELTQTEVEPIQTELEPAPSHSLTELEPAPSHSLTELEQTLSHSPTKVELTQTEVEPIQTVLEPAPSHSPTEVELTQTEVEPTEEKQPQPRPPMRSPCGAQCRRKCTDHMSDDRRKEIWKQYWDMTYTERRTWIFHSVTSMETKRVSTAGSRRGQTFSYKLQDQRGEPRRVCKMFFLSTLGYNPKNDSLVMTMMGKARSRPLVPPQDQRGRQVAANKLDAKQLLDHIESFHPTVSHYRREHAPHRRYLPSDITMKMMHGDYVEKGNACSYEAYRKAVREKKISFAKLGEEECETCLKHAEHEKAHTEEMVNCPECQSWQKHKQSALQSRLSYKQDAETSCWPDDTSVRSADLQKVIMLPRMPGVKSSVFTRRVVAFHETFASVGKGKNKKNTISVLWHEGIAGRSAAEITSAYMAALEKERDVRHIILWVDNCSAQNKNWCLLSSLVTLVNSDTTSLEDIILKYFEPGHTFMSADSFHHGVEQQIRKCPGGVVYDFEDFVNVVASSNSRKVDVVLMQNANVLDWKDGHSTSKVKKAKAPKLGEMAEIQVRRGSKSLFYKLSHVETEFTEMDFLLKKFIPTIPTLLRPQDRGVDEVKKRDIIDKLCPLMPPNRRGFWHSLPVMKDVLEDEE